MAKSGVSTTDSASNFHCLTHASTQYERTRADTHTRANTKKFQYLSAYKLEDCQQNTNIGRQADDWNQTDNGVRL